MRKTTLAALMLALSGCASPLLNQPYSAMPDDDLLAYYYRLQNASGDSDRDLAGVRSQYNADRLFNGPVGGLHNSIWQGIIEGQGQALREREVVVRVELERRGWTPDKGLPQHPIGQESGQTQDSAVPAGYVEKPRLRAAPEVVGLKEESKYMVSAEGIAKVSGCNPPNAAMTSKGAGEESFIVACPNGTAMAIRCGFDGCRILR